VPPGAAAPAPAAAPAVAPAPSATAAQPPAAASAQPAAPTPTAPTAPGPAQARAFSVAMALEEVHSLRDPGWNVTVEAESTTVRIGQGQLRFRIGSERAGFVYLLMVGTDRSHFYQLFPNALDGNNRIAAGGTLQLPRPNWMMVAGGPPGTNRFLAIVAPSPRDFASAGLKIGKPFSEFDLRATANAFAANGASVLAGMPVNCRLPPDACDAFGAAMFEIREAN